MTTAPLLQPVSDRGRCYLPVPWDRADDLHVRLRRLGHPSTLCLDPEARQARLELWPGVPPESAVTALGELLSACTPARLLRR
jgi:hypothetical protein